jgi:signal transduction histidine kinase
MARYPRPSATLARWLVVAIGGVVVSFLLVTAVARWTGRHTDAAVVEITEVSMPNLEALASAQRALRRADDLALRLLESRRHARETAAHEALDRPPIGGEAVDHLEHDRADVNSAFETYARTAAPEDAPLCDRARAEILSADTWLEALVAAIDRGDRRAAGDAFDRRHAAVDRVDDALEALMDRSATRGAQRGNEIRVARGRTRTIVMSLDAVCVVLALFAAALALVSMRRIVLSLEEANRRAEERAAELDLFAGRAAHDLVGPLTAPMFALQMVRRQLPDDEQLQSAVRRGLAGLGRAGEVADGLLEFARAGAPLEVGACAPVVEVARDCVDAVLKGPDAEGVDVRLEAGEPLCVACNPGVLTSILANLLRNAVKHMGNAPVREVRVETVMRDRACRMSVIDSGPGVPEGLEETIFEPFVRAHTDKPGVGLGLATVKRLANAYGGAAGYQRVGDRSVFWVNLPIAPAVAPPGHA